MSITTKVAQVTHNSTMSQDVIATDKIPVSSTSQNPIGVFKNPNAGGIDGNALMEALCIVDGEQNGASAPILCHIARDHSTAAGWKLEKLFQGRTARLVAAGTAFPGSSAATVYGFYQDDTEIFSTALGAGGWTEPVSIQKEKLFSLKVAYAPDGLLLVYGNTDKGDLFTAYQKKVGGPFVGVTCDMKGQLAGGDFHLCMVDGNNWQVAANVNGKPMIFTGMVGAGEFASAEQAANYQGTLKQVVLGYWNDVNQTVMFLFVDDDQALRIWSANEEGEAVTQAISNAKVVQATGHVSEDGSLHVYSIDTDQNLWVLHQSPDTPWNLYDGTPNWAPNIALDKNIAHVASDITPTDAPSLFAMDSAAYELRLHVQDTQTRMWRSGPVMQSSEQAFEITRFRTEVNFLDENGSPVPNKAVTLKLADNTTATEIAVGAGIHPMRPDDDGLRLTSDALGKLSFSILTTQGFVSPRFILEVDDVPPVTIGPSDPVHTYLSGKGTLNPTNPGGPLPEFDENGATLSAAEVGGSPLAPKAKDKQLAGTVAKAVRQTAKVGLGHPMGETAYYAVHLQGENDGPDFLTFDSKESYMAHLERTFGEIKDAPGSLWGDISHFFGDVWEGIKNGLITIKDALVDVADKIANFTVEIGDWIAKGVKMAIKGIEQAAHFIAGVLQWVEAAIEKVIDWLKALFDFKAIWRTKMAIEQGLNAAPDYIKQVLGLGEKAGANWFSRQRHHVDDAFAALKEKYAGQSFGQQPNWQPPGHGASHKKVAGNAAPSDFCNNGHHNWLQDKLSSHGKDPGVSEDLGSVWNAFTTETETAVKDFKVAITDFQNASAVIIGHPKEIGKVAIPDFIDMLNKLVDGLLAFADAILELLVKLGKTAMDALNDLLTTELHLGFLNTLWRWIAQKAGNGEDDKLTVSSLMSLFMAFPTTIIYKLIRGTDHEPFPDGRFPGLDTLGAYATQMPGSMPGACLMASAILQIMYVLPAVISELLGPDAPWWLALISVGMSITIWILAHGFPDLSALEWASVSAAAANLLWIIPVVYFISKDISATFLDRVKAARGEIPPILFTLYGAGALVLGIVSDATRTMDAEQSIAKVLLPIPSAFSFLDLSDIRNDGTVIARTVLEFVGYVGGGMLLLVDARKA